MLIDGREPPCSRKSWRVFAALAGKLFVILSLAGIAVPAWGQQGKPRPPRPAPPGKKTPSDLAELKQLPAAGDTKSTPADVAATSQLPPWNLPAGCRPHADGPLTVRDFQGKPPADPPQGAGGPLDSWVDTQIRYRYWFSGEIKDGQATLRLAEIEFLPVVDAKQTWTTRPDDKFLLDHEQGHFDITAIESARMAKEFRELIADGGMTSQSPTQPEASRDLEAKIRERYQREMVVWREAQIAYDQQTRHGADYSEQFAHRRLHREALERIAKERTPKEPTSNQGGAQE